MSSVPSFRAIRTVKSSNMPCGSYRRWDGPDQFEDPSGQIMMLPSDMALVWDKGKLGQLYLRNHGVMSMVISVDQLSIIVQTNDKTREHTFVAPPATLSLMRTLTLIPVVLVICCFLCVEWSSCATTGFRKVVEEYTADEEVFFKDFSAAFAKLLALGTPKTVSGGGGGGLFSSILSMLGLGQK